MTRQHRIFTPECKLQLVKFYENSKSRADIAREYDITSSVLDHWIKNHHEAGSFAAKDNLTEENQRLQMENDILKSKPLLLNLMIMFTGLITFEFTEH